MINDHSDVSLHPVHHLPLDVLVSYYVKHGPIYPTKSFCRVIMEIEWSKPNPDGDVKTDVVPLRPCSKNSKSKLTGSMINLIASFEDTLEIGSGESLLIWQKENFEHPRLQSTEVKCRMFQCRFSYWEVWVMKTSKRRWTTGRRPPPRSWS